MPAVFFYDPVYTDGLSPEARFPRDRYREVHSALARRGVDKRAEVRPSPEVELADLHLAHTPGYVQAFMSGQLEERAARRIGLRPWTERIVERTLRILGGSVAAVHALYREQLSAAGNLAGGTHHAFADEGSGYCVFNDIAVAARVAQRDHGVERIAVIDLDVHQGDGTAAIFAEDPSVHTVSVHCARNFPFRKENSDVDLSLPEKAGDEPYLEATTRALDAVAAYAPELLVYQAGVDALAEDHLGRLQVSQEALRERNERVFRWAEDREVPVLVLMGGGYARPLHHTVEALADVFERAAEQGRRTRGSGEISPDAWESGRRGGP